MRSNQQPNQQTPNERNTSDHPTHLSVKAAQSAICRVLRIRTSSIPTETVPLLQAVGRVMAEDVRAALSQPPFTNAAMDGYALNSSDLHRSPLQLPVDGIVAAGAGEIPPLPQGSARRIMTGAPLPPNSNCVVRFEDTERVQTKNGEQEAVRILVPVAPGDNVRQAGEVLQAGDLLLSAGHRLHELDLVPLAAQGIAAVCVRRRPRVGILATGDEIQRPGTPLRPGQIYDANSPALGALVARFGGEPVPLGIVGDDADALRRQLAHALDTNLDLLVTSAGVSVGDFDLVKGILDEVGQVDFWQVGIKPGKPLAFGHLSRNQTPTLPLLGLPGNPVAAAVAAYVFLRPAIQTLLGQPPRPPLRVHAHLQESLCNSGRRNFLRAHIEWDGTQFIARPSGSSSSADTTGLSRANGFLIVPEEVSEVATGDRLEAWLVRVED